MTLIMSISTPKTIWILADRRLSYPGGAKIDNARKITEIQTQHDVALIGYSGLGKTVNGTEPSDWVSNVLRGTGFPIEHSLQLVADAMQREFPRHLTNMGTSTPSDQHFLVPAFVDKEPRIYTIVGRVNQDNKTLNYQFVRHKTAHGATPRFAFTGSGAHTLAKFNGWKSANLRKLVKAYNVGRVTEATVADAMAEVNNYAHVNTADGSVGPSCIVLWRHSQGGGAHQFYENCKRIPDDTMLAGVANGIDVPALLKTILPEFLERSNIFHQTGIFPPLDEEKLRSLTSKLPDTPDEFLN